MPLGRPLPPCRPSPSARWYGLGPSVQSCPVPTIRRCGGGRGEGVKGGWGRDAPLGPRNGFGRGARTRSTPRAAPRPLLRPLPTCMKRRSERNDKHMNRERNNKQKKRERKGETTAANRTDGGGLKGCILKKLAHKCRGEGKPVPDDERETKVLREERYL